MVRRTVLFSVKIGVTLALGAWLFKSVDTDHLRKLAAGLGIGPSMAALALLFAQAGIMSVRWRSVLRLFGCRLGLFLALRWTWVGLFFNQALPTSVGGDALRIWLLRRTAAVDAGTAFASVAIERVTGIALLGLLVSACMPFYWNDFPRPLRPALAGAGPALFLLVLLLAFADRAAVRWLPRTLIPALLALSRGLRALARGGRPMAVIVASGVASSLCGLGSAYLLGHDLGVTVGFGGVVVALGSSMLISVLPVSIGGWGVREASVVAMYGALGVARESALAVSLLWGLLQLLVSLPGGVLWWWETRASETPLRHVNDPVRRQVS